VRTVADTLPVELLDVDLCWHRNLAPTQIALLNDILRRGPESWGRLVSLQVTDLQSHSVPDGNPHSTNHMLVLAFQIRLILLEQWYRPAWEHSLSTTVDPQPTLMDDYYFSLEEEFLCFAYWFHLVKVRFVDRWISRHWMSLTAFNRIRWI
jgi:hypothetical protein